MLKLVGKIEKISDKKIFLRFISPQDECQQCAAGNGCGAKYFSLFSKKRLFPLPRNENQQIGDILYLQIPEKLIFYITCLHYALAIFVLFLILYLTRNFPELGQFFLAISGTISTFLLTSHYFEHLLLKSLGKP